MSNNKRNTADRYFKEGKLDQALELYQQLLSESTQAKDELHHAVAIIHAYRHDYANALDSIKAALSITPHNVVYLNTQGNILMRLKRYDAAIKIFQQAIKQKPDYAIAYNNLANCLIKQDKWIAAEKALKKAIQLDANYADAYYNLALTLAKQSKLTEAIRQLELLIKKHPHMTKALGQLGEFYLEQGEPEKAIPVLEQRLALQPQQSETHHSLAQAYALTDHFEEAIQHYEKTLALSPNHEEVYHNLATATLNSGDAAKALTYYMRQLEIAPRPETYYNIGVILMYQERHKEALQFLNLAAERDPLHLGTQLNIASIYLRQRRYQDAITHYEKALALSPDDTEIAYILSALKSGETPERAPDKYLKSLFNQYANYYDEHLTKYLKYDVPNQLAKAIYEETGVDTPTYQIVDLGCGTGLSGAAVKNIAKHLIGVDLSEDMVAIAAKKDIYDDVQVGEALTTLQQINNIDIIIAADVFTYIGDLDAIIAAAKVALVPGGLLCFSVEKGHETPYTLQKTLRYAHSRQYIETLAKAHDFTLLRCDNIVLRQQKNDVIEGYCVVMKA